MRTPEQHHDQVWSGWDQPLAQFAETARVTLSLFDAESRRRSGPHVASPVGELLSKRDAWGSEGPVPTIERRLVAQSLADGVAKRERFAGVLAVEALPLTQFGERVGAVVFGWICCASGSTIPYRSLAETLGVPYDVLWKELRHTAPIRVARLDVFRELLETLVHTHAQHAEAIARLEALSQARQMAVAQVSHDLRTPMSSLQLRLQLLLESSLDNRESIRDTLGAMRNNVTHQSRLLSELVGTAEQTSARVTALAPTSLRTVVQHAHDTLIPHAHHKSISLGLAMAHGSMNVVGNAAQLERVFSNLLANAIKFTPPRGEVIVRMDGDDGRVRVAVDDSGPGVEAAILERAFEPYVRATVDNPTGSGLGLFIARQIVEAHRGTIRADRSDRGGARFLVELPRLRG